MQNKNEKFHANNEVIVYYLKNQMEPRYALGLIKFHNIWGVDYPDS